MKIVVFTGAGVSRESGLRTFRDSADGLWEGHDVMSVASMEGFRRDPMQVYEFYNTRRREIRAAKPNAAHLAIAELETDHEVIVVTQNVDDLHERAGSTNVIHLHGEALKARTFENETETIPWLEDLGPDDRHPVSGKRLRPFVVWFGEGLPELPRAMEEALAADVDILIVVGTTLNVYPAAFIATETQAKHIFVVDPEPPDLRQRNVKYIVQPATIGMQQVLQEIAALSAS